MAMPRDDDVTIRRRKNVTMLAFKRSFASVRNVNRAFLPSTVKTCPWGVNREQGFDVFPHW